MDWLEVAIVTVMINDILFWINNSELWFMNLWEKFWSSLSHFFMIKKESCSVSKFWFMDLCEINFDFFANPTFRTAVPLLNIEHCYRSFEFDNCNFLIRFKSFAKFWFFMNITEKLHKFNYGNLSLLFRTEYLWAHLNMGTSINEIRISVCVCMCMCSLPIDSSLPIDDR